jgi:hypothetical protein
MPARKPYTRPEINAILLDCTISLICDSGESGPPPYPTGNFYADDQKTDPSPFRKQMFVDHPLDNWNR